MTLRSLLLRCILDTPLEPVARSMYTALLPTRGARYDRQLAAVLRRVLQPDSNTVDVGAHRGAVLRDLMRHAPRGTHLAIEPIPEHARYLANRFPQARVVQCALNDAPGEAEFFHVVTRPTRSGLRRVDYPSASDEVEPITVPVARLDDVVPPGLRISLIKIDVEGAEHGVLAGGIDLIRRDRPVIVFEHGTLAARYYGVESSQVYRLLVVDCGMTVSTMERWLSGKAPLGEADFVNEVTTRGGYYFMAYG